MIHTANFYLLLDSSDIDFIENKYNESLSLLKDTLSNKSITVYFTSFYGNQYMHLNIDFIKLLNKSNINENDREKNVKIKTEIYFPMRKMY